MYPTNSNGESSSRPRTTKTGKKSSTKKSTKSIAPGFLDVRDLDRDYLHDLAEGLLWERISEHLGTLMGLDAMRPEDRPRGLQKVYRAALDRIETSGVCRFLVQAWREHGVPPRFGETARNSPFGPGGEL